MTVVTIAMKTACCALREPAHQTVSAVPTIDAFLQLGIVMAMMIVAIRQMSLKTTANLKRGPASEIFSPATMATASLEYISAMGTMIAWTTVTKIQDINVIPENVMKIVNLLALRIATGAEPNVFQNDGFVMVNLIVSMELMKIPHFTNVQHQSLAKETNSAVRTTVVSTKNGSVITIMIVAMEVMNIVIAPSGLAHPMNSHVKMPNASGKHTFAMERMM